MDQDEADQDERLLWAWLESYQTTIASVDGDIRQFLTEKETTIWDCYQASEVFLLGFPAIAEGRIPASEITVRWVRAIDTRRTAALQANLLAVNIVVVLDALVQELTTYLCEKPVKAFAAKHHRLASTMNFSPSASERNGKQSWIGGPGSLFDIRIDQTVTKYLGEMVTRRNTAAHRLLDITGATNGETIVDWFLSAKILLWQLSYAAWQILTIPSGVGSKHPGASATQGSD
jgi:hypothetical protein